MKSSGQKLIDSIPGLDYQFWFSSSAFKKTIAYARDKIVSLTRKKRIALIAILIREQRMRSNDSLIGLFVKEIRKCHNKAKLDLTAFQDASTGESEKLVCVLREITLAMRAHGGLQTLAIRGFVRKFQYIV